MKILKVNELRSDVYISAGNRLRSDTYRGDKQKERGFELIKWGKTKEKIPGEYWVTRLGNGRLYEAWIIPELVIREPFKDISKIIRDAEKHFRLNNSIDPEHKYSQNIGIFNLYFHAFEFDPVNYKDYSNSYISINIDFSLEINKDGKQNIKTESYISGINFIFSNRADAVKFKKEIQRIDWIRHLRIENKYKFKIGDEENTKDIIYEYSLFSLITKEFQKSKLSVNNFWG